MLLQSFSRRIIDDKGLQSICVAKCETNVYLRYGHNRSNQLTSIAANNDWRSLPGSAIRL